LKNRPAPVQQWGQAYVSLVSEKIGQANSAEPELTDDLNFDAVELI
jgi:hypothetical protein